MIASFISGTAGRPLPAGYAFISKGVVQLKSQPLAAHCWGGNENIEVMLRTTSEISCLLISVGCDVDINLQGSNDTCLKEHN